MWQQIRRFFGLGVERRSTDGNPIYNDGWRGWGELGYKSTAGPTVNRTTALSVPAIWAAVDTISKTLASIEFGIFELTEKGSKPAKSHPVYHLVRLEPTPNLGFYSAYSFKYALFANACFGDAYAKIHRNGIGRPTDIELLDPEYVTLFQLDTGELYYVVRRTIGNRYTEEVIRPRDMVHIKGLTLTGWLGEKVVSTQRDSIGVSISAEQFGNYFYANGANPSGALVFPNAITDPRMRDNVERKLRDKYGGHENTGKLMVLDGGVRFEKFSLNPGEAMMNETRKFQVNQSARLFGVPVPMLGELDNATLNNIETLQTQFVNLCLRPWAEQVEQEFALKLLTYNERLSERFFFRFNFVALLRGDTDSRAAYYKAALGGPSTGIGWMTVNEIRRIENLDDVDDGDTVFTAEMLMEAQQAGKNDTQKMEESEADDAGDDSEKDTDNGTPQASGN